MYHSVTTVLFFVYCRSWPQVGGGITTENALEFLEAGGSGVLSRCTSEVVKVSVQKKSWNIVELLTQPL